MIGLGVSGLAAARALAAAGAAVCVSEAGDSSLLRRRARELAELGVEAQLGGHDLAALKADLAVVSPGIAPNAPVMRALRSRGIEIIAEIELAWRLAACDFLAVTGTNGKTTTTALLATMLRESGIASVAGGNIGLALVEAVSALPAHGAVAVEVSSFQLESIDSFRPRVAVLLNVAEDHTDWHGSLEQYRKAKARVFKNQEADDVAVVNGDDAIAMSLSLTSRARIVPFSTASAPEDGIGVAGESILWRGREIMSTRDVSLPGLSGLEDTLAATAAALEYGVHNDAIVRAVAGFSAPPHRLELVAEIDGIAFIDDSKATNPHATLAATRGVRDAVLIAGGRAKGIDLSPLAAAVPPVVAVIVMGEAAEDMASVFDALVPVERAATMTDAVRRALTYATRGGSVLLSPGCASLDMYTDYAERGDDFARSVRAIADEREAGGHGGT